MNLHGTFDFRSQDGGIQAKFLLSCSVGHSNLFFRMQKQRIKPSRATRLLKVASEIASFCLEIVTWELHQIIRSGGAVCTDAPALERRGRIVWQLREARCMPRTCCRTIPPRRAPPSPLDRSHGHTTSALRLRTPIPSDAASE